MPNAHPLVIALMTGALLSLPVLAQESAVTPPAVQGTPGRVIGGKMSSHPDWFKESFLDITEDVKEASETGKHLILIMEMNGCPYCAKMIEENFKTVPYRDFIQEKFDVIALNVHGDREVAIDADTSMTEKALAGHLGVTYTPTLLFLNAANEPVARVNGYRNVADFKRVLDYVAAKAYEERTLAEFLAAEPVEGRYAFRADSRIQVIDDLSGVTDKPLAILFEDAACTACDALHDGHLADPKVDAALKDLVLTRLDARSDAPITAPDGSKTTARQLAEDLGIGYRPTLVLYDQGREIARIESQLYRYHFIGLLEYVGQRHYRKYPDSPFDYINAKTAELTAAGKDVSIADD
ncbi:thioredoxin family protein [Thiocystis violacea]|uniref:thioredoxin family protein n=1 Tax=Thiocystis violacea TaxID=13725 RepID=UPI001F5B4423|nr:thioredoxin fold domain-containing protein [Thiocystis violacea]MBK1719670.1 thioredoxin [Thiocystis violacea]